VCTVSGLAEDMEQFAALCQSARAGEAENDKAVELMLNSPQTLSARSEWDIPLKEMKSAEVPAAKIGSSDDERSYYNAIASHKRGDDALVEHLNRKSRTKRVRANDEASMDGVGLSSRNAAFNERLQK